MALTGRFTPSGSGTLGRPEGLVEESEHNVMMGMVEAYMGAAVAEHNKMCGLVGGGVQWLDNDVDVWEEVSEDGDDEEAVDEEAFDQGVDELGIDELRLDEGNHA